MKYKNSIITTLCAWLIFIMIDFFFHASVFTRFWLSDQPALKPLTNLAQLIPAGYGSFLILTILCGWLYHQVYPEFPGYVHVCRFGAVFGLLFALSNLLGLFSYIRLSVSSLLLINVVYFIEIVSVILIYGYFQTEGKRSHKVGRILILFILGMIVSIIIQNVFGMYQTGG